MQPPMALPSSYARQARSRGDLSGNYDPAAMVSNAYSIECPPKSGPMQSFPEIDRAASLTGAQIHEKLNPAMNEFVERLKTALGSS